MTSQSLANINYIKIMTYAEKRYETVPKCKEMILDSMFHHIATLSQRASNDSFIQTVVDGSTLDVTQGSKNWSGAPTTTTPS
jgi:hypothetical protein